MKRFLFRFGFESPAERESNRSLGTDFESSEAIWIRAISEEDAFSKGRSYAERYVAKLYSEDHLTPAPPWKADDFAHWIPDHPEQELPREYLNSLPEI
jgi:hypothetical protein